MELCSVNFLCISNAYPCPVPPMKMKKRCPSKFSKYCKAPFLCLCNRQKERRLRIGKILTHRFRISPTLLYKLKLGFQWPFFAKLNYTKFTWSIILLDLVLDKLDILLWIRKIGHWNNCWMRVNLLLESNELIVCKYVPKPTAGHAYTRMAKSCSSNQFRYFK